MTHFDVFDPPRCARGTSVDPRIAAAFEADIAWLTARGVRVARYDLADDPEAFLVHPIVNDLLRREGPSCLPVVVMNSDVVAHRRYPRLDELAPLAGLTTPHRPSL